MNTRWFDKQRLLEQGVCEAHIDSAYKLMRRDCGLWLMEPDWSKFYRGEYDLCELFTRWYYTELMMETGE